MSYHYTSGFYDGKTDAKDNPKDHPNIDSIHDNYKGTINAKQEYGEGYIDGWEIETGKSIL